MRKEITKEFISNDLNIPWILKEKKIKEMALENESSSRKRIHKWSYNEISVWFKQLKAKDSAINGLTLMEKANEFSKLREIKILYQIMVQNYQNDV